jgi:hypothetical protein
MQVSKNDVARQALVKAGKLEERHASRPSLEPQKVAQTEDDLNRIRPELIAIGLFLVVLIILAAMGF